MHNNPINNIDPSGNMSIVSVSMAITVISIIAFNPTILNAPGPNDPTYADNSGDMIIDLYIGMALIPVAVVGGKLISGLKYKYLKWRGKPTTIIHTSTGKVGIPGKKLGDATFVNPGRTVQIFIGA